MSIALLKLTDPAPSKLIYRLNRLLYKLWFKAFVSLVFLAIIFFLGKGFFYDKMDLGENLKLLSAKSFNVYRDLTDLKVRKIVVTGAGKKLEQKIISLVNDTATKGFSALKARSLREKVEKMNLVKNAFVKFSADGLVEIRVIERNEVAVYFNNRVYEVLDGDGFVLSVIANYNDVPSLPLLVGKSAKKNVKSLLSLIDNMGVINKDISYFEWVGERRWDIHMKNKVLFKLPETNLNKGLELMSVFLSNHNESIGSIVAIDLRNLDKPIIKFKEIGLIEETDQKNKIIKRLDI